MFKCVNNNAGLHWNDWKDHNFRKTYPLDCKEISEPPENGDYIGNAILGEKTRLDMDRVWGMNLNMLIQGTPGTGKTRSFIKPNLLQFNSSYVVTDPCGELLETTGAALVRHGYRVKCLDLTDMQHSDRYDPFRYVKDVNDLEFLAECLMKNTEALKAPEDDGSFRRTEEFLLLAIMDYIRQELPADDQHLGMILDILKEAGQYTDDDDEKTVLDTRFEKLGAQCPDRGAVNYYRVFSQKPDDIRRDIVTSCLARLEPFRSPEFKLLTSEDTLRLEEIGDRKQILYIIAPVENRKYNFLASMAYTQLFQALYDRSDDNRHCWMIRKGPNTVLRSPVWHTGDEKEKYRRKLEDEREAFLNAELDGLTLSESGSHTPLMKFQSMEEYEIFMDCVRNGEIVYSKDTLRLPCNVRCIMDEFANTFVIPGIDTILNTCRKYDISCDLIIMSLGQLKRMYGDDYSAVTDGCSIKIFMAVQDADDVRWVSGWLGDRDDVLSGPVRRKRLFRSAGTGALMTADKIRNMDRGMCIIFIPGEAPYLDKRYQLESHRNYSEFDTKRPENRFDNTKYFGIAD